MAHHNLQTQLEAVAILVLLQVIVPKVINLCNALLDKTAQYFQLNIADSTPAAQATTELLVHASEELISALHENPQYISE